VVWAFFRRATERVEGRLALETDPVARIGTYLTPDCGLSWLLARVADSARAKPTVEK
jgi:hypothetical protein